MVGKFERIQVFIEVAERRGFAAAARHLGMSRSVATRQVADLEADLGVQLLVRTTRSVTLTLAGQTYLDRVKSISLDLERTDDLVRQQQHSLQGTLRISAPLSLGMRFLPDAVAQFRLLYSTLTLKLHLTDRLVDILSEDYDMALRISGPPSDKSTIWRKICGVPRVLVAAPGYLARRGTPRTPADLNDHDCLGYSHFAGGRQWDFSCPGDEKWISVTVEQPIECNNGEVIAGLAERGEGIALLPLFVVSRQIEAGVLVPVLPDWRLPDVWLTATYPPYEVLPTRVQAFTHFIEDLVTANSAMLV